MSGLVGPDGKTPIQSEAAAKRYRAGGLQFDTPVLPEHMLQKALKMAQTAMGQQVFAQTMQRTNNKMVAEMEAQTATAATQDPFTLEPAAMAVFMYMVREIEYRDSIIEQMNARLVALGAEALDLTHPYPPPAMPEKADEEDEDEDEDEGDGESEGEAGDPESPASEPTDS